VDSLLVKVLVVPWKGVPPVVIKILMIPSSILQKCHNDLFCHRVHEVIASKYVIFCHIDGHYNPADVLNNRLLSHECFGLKKLLNFGTLKDDEPPLGGDVNGSV
jgi:hypothetical protein